MTKALQIRPDGALDFLSLGALIHRLDPGVVPFRKAHDVRDPRQRRRVQHRRQPGRLLRPAHRHRQRDGRLPDRRSHRRARPGDGRHAVLQALQARRRARPEHGDGLQRPRLRRARPVVFYNRANEAAALLKPGDFDWNGDLRRRRALVPQRRHLRRALRHDLRADHRSHGGRQGARRRRVVRPQLPREALERVRRRRTRAVRCSDASSSTSTCSSATKRTCRRASASPGPEVAAKSEARSAASSSA